MENYFLIMIIFLSILVSHSPLVFADHLSTAFSLPQPLSYYKFDGDVIDYGVLKQNGIIMGNEAYVDGKIGKAFNFDGNTYIFLSNDSSYNFERSNMFSISFWMKEQGAGNYFLISKETHDELQGYSIQTYNGNIAFNLYGTSPKNSIIKNSDNTYNDGKYHFIVLTYDGTSSAIGMDFYVDGEKIPTRITSDNLTTSISNNAPLVIGSQSDGTYKFKGQIDDLHMYNIELTPAQVNFLYYGFFQPAIVEIIILAISVLSIAILSKKGILNKINEMVDKFVGGDNS